MALENASPGHIAGEAVKGAGIGALAVGAWHLLKTFALGTATFIEGMVPVVLPGAAIGAAAFGLIALFGSIFPPAKK